MIITVSFSVFGGGSGCLNMELPLHRKPTTLDEVSQVTAKIIRIIEKRNNFDAGSVVITNIFKWCDTVAQTGEA